MDSVEARWRRLEPHVHTVGPDDDRPRPAVLLFHGCGGLRSHLPRYAEAAKAAGWRAFIVDSYGPRGWGRLQTLSLICTGAAFRGHERGGDILAAIHGLSQRPDIDPARLVVAGWSHGGWGIMELLSAPREKSGELGLTDPQIVSLSGLIGSVLIYPYVGPWAFARKKPWRANPRTLTIIASGDHLTTVRNAEAIMALHRQGGAEIETWTAEGTHAFDEPTSNGPMRHSPESTRQALSKFSDFLSSFDPAPR